MKMAFLSGLLIRLATVFLVLLGSERPAGAVAWRWPIFCWFETNSVTLSDRCKLILAETVDSWHREQDGKQYASDNLNEGLAPPYKARCEVRGYAQDAFNAADNDRLSLRRALAVSNELRTLGVPDDLITTIGFGDEAPLVPNAPQDPQNRRSQVILR